MARANIREQEAWEGGRGEFRCEAPGRVKGYPKLVEVQPCLSRRSARDWLLEEPALAMTPLSCQAGAILIRRSAVPGKRVDKASRCRLATLPRPVDRASRRHVDKAVRSSGPPRPWHDRCQDPSDPIHGVHAHACRGTSPNVGCDLDAFTWQDPFMDAGRRTASANGGAKAPEASELTCSREKLTYIVVGGGIGVVIRVL